MRIYVTGIAGFVGSNLAEYLLGQGHSVFGSDNMSGGNPQNIPQRVRWELLDLNTDDITSYLHGTDVVYHCAAHAHEGLSVFSPRTICRSIYEASISVFSACAQARVKRVVFCSSMSRYGDNAAPFTEEQKPNPRDPYAIAKVAAEETLRVLARTHGFEYVIAVPHNIVGKNQKYDDPFRNVCAIMANRMLLDLRPIVYGDGSQTRCFSDIRDLLPVLAQFGTQPGLSGRVFNVGPDEQVVSIEEMGQTLAEVIGCKWEPQYVPDRPCEVKNAHCSSELIRKEFGYKTQYSLKAMLGSLVDHIRDRGPKPFDYYLPVEIVSDKTPKFWTKEIE